MTNPDDYDYKENRKNKKNKKDKIYSQKRIRILEMLKEKKDIIRI